MSLFKKMQYFLQFIIVVFLCVILFQSNASAYESASLSGETPGSFNVHNGAAAYSIPIKVPPGVNKLEPRLGLKYNSHAPDGLLGLGWSISGLSVIYRGGATIAQDGFNGGVSYNERDRFFMNGQRLIAISGSNGGIGSEYRTEIDGFFKIVSEGSAGSGPSFFTVTTRNGLIMEYGKTADSQVEAQGATSGSVQQWMLNKVRDTSGNELTYTYHEDNANGESHVTRIDYAGGKNSVRFEYEVRHDPMVKYLAGSKNSIAKRLKSVKSYARNGGVDTLVKEYRLSYKPSSNYAKSLLESVQEFDLSENALPALRFTWDIGANGFDSHANWLSMSLT